MSPVLVDTFFVCSYFKITKQNLILNLNIKLRMSVNKENILIYSLCSSTASQILLVFSAAIFSQFCFVCHCLSKFFLCYGKNFCKSVQTSQSAHLLRQMWSVATQCNTFILTSLNFANGVVQIQVGISPFKTIHHKNS